MEKLPIHEVVRRLRLSRGWTQEKLANELDVNVTTLSRWENQGGIKENHIEAIAKAFQIKPMEIYSMMENPSILSEPFEKYGVIKKKVSVVVELDGTVATLNDWYTTLKKLNAAML